MPRHPQQPFVVPLPRRKRTVFPYAFFLFSLFLAVSALSSLFAVLFRPAPFSIPFLNFSKEAAAYPSKPRFTVLVLGVDSDREPRRSDTLMIFFVDSKAKKSTVFSIPRDTRVEIPGHGVDKINHAYAFGGVELSRATVESLLGSPLDYYLKVNFQGFVKMVDLLGGVELNVEKRMRYRDRSQNLYIDLYPGYQKLDGYRAMGYVRFRHDRYGDLGRVERQQKFLQALTQKALSPGQVLRWPALLKTAYQMIETDMPYGLALSLVGQFKNFDARSLSALTLPGVPKMIAGISYFIPDLSYPQRIMHEFQLGLDLDFLGLDMAILNGTDVPGLAATTRDWLMEQGIPISDIGDARRRYEKTVLRFSKKNLAAYDKVRSLFPDAEVEWSEEGQKATIILGKDFKEKYS